tara:strand:- start:480 stop:1013 length:534 start_codon:yes stop_codon:yes gene_type:complete
MESEYGIFMSDAGKDQQKLDNIKGLTQAMMQNGAKPGDIAEMLDSDSFTQIKKNLRLADKAQQELEQAQQQAQQEMQQQQLEAEQLKLQSENVEREKDRQKDIEIALISAESKDQSDVNSLNLEKMIQDFEIRKRELELKEQELQMRMQNDLDSNAVKREDIQSKRDIAKENANKSG